MHTETLLVKYYNNVRSFHQAMVFHIGDPRAPGFLNDEEAGRRRRLTAEETGETVDRGIIGGDRIELIDGLCDTLYVALGTAISVGFDHVLLVPWNEPKTVHDPKLLLSRAHYFKDMLRGASQAACEAIDARDVDACRATTVGLVYVLNAIVNAWNIPLEPFWDEVHRANMQKWPPNEPGGKARKPPGWIKPQHEPIFFRVFGLAEDKGSGPEAVPEVVGAEPQVEQASHDTRRWVAKAGS